MTQQMTASSHRTPIASVIIPAYNEARVIGRCLRALASGAEPGEFDVVVVCNGCSDDTEAAARGAGTGARVFSIDEASKTAALNYGDRVAAAFPRVYLDADLEVGAAAVRSLVLALGDGRRLAAIGYMDVDLGGCSWAVRRFYRVWLLHPYLRAGKFGGIYALSTEGWERRGPYPPVVADDTFVRERFAPHECTAVEACRFRVFPPRTLRDVVRIRSRAYLGNRQLRDRGDESAGWESRAGEVAGWVRRVFLRPDAWAGIPLYVAVNLAAKMSARRLHRQSRFHWLRDESSRAAEPGTSAA